jgi:hypothetical protein
MADVVVLRVTVTGVFFHEVGPSLLGMILRSAMGMTGGSSRLFFKESGVDQRIHVSSTIGIGVHDGVLEFKKVLGDLADWPDVEVGLKNRQVRRLGWGSHEGRRKEKERIATYRSQIRQEVAPRSTNLFWRRHSARIVEGAMRNILERKILHARAFMKDCARSVPPQQVAKGAPASGPDVGQTRFNSHRQPSAVRSWEGNHWWKRAQQVRTLTFRMTNGPQLWYGTREPRKQRREGARKVNAAQQERVERYVRGPLGVSRPKAEAIGAEL